MNARALPYVLAVGALLGLTALAFAVGRYPVSLADLVSVFIGKSAPANVETVVMQVRGPRVLAALVVGAALAAAGTAYQGMFRNPLVSPDILGVSTGAALGAVWWRVLCERERTPLLAFWMGPLGAALVVYARGRVHRFTGSGLPISQWHFADAGTRIAFGQEPAHFGCTAHFELRDIESDRLIDSSGVPVA